MSFFKFKSLVLFIKNGKLYLEVIVVPGNEMVQLSIIPSGGSNLQVSGRGLQVNVSPIQKVS